MLTDRERNLLDRAATALRAGDIHAASRFCGEVLERIPGDPEALNILGAVEFARHNYARAEQLFALSAGASPENTGALFNLGKVHEVQQRFDDAAAVYEKILSRQPKNLQTRLRLGIVRYQQGAVDEAIAAFEGILQDQPDDDQAALSLGVAYNSIARYDDSVRVLRGLLARQPQIAEAHHALADSLFEMHRLEEAASACRVALASEPTDLQATILLGQIECDRGDYAGAERHFRNAASRAPERFEPPMNLGVLFQRLGRIDEALEQGGRAVELAPSEPLAHMNYGMGLLLAAEFATGWREFEWRMLDLRMRDHYPYRKVLPLWTGERFEGRVLVAREQGLGDFLLFSRLFAAAKERIREMLVETPPELLPLYQETAGINVISGRAGAGVRETAQAHIPLCSLPFVLGIDAASIPARVPYLKAPPERVSHFREQMSAFAAGGALRVGIVWAGSPGHLLDRYRSAPARAYAALADLPGIAWFSLQKGAHEPMAALPIIDFAGELHDFGDTAAAVEALDLIVSVDTAVAHLAGALAKPVWLLNGFGSYWLWQLGRDDSPWYPTMRVFRQPSPNDWTGLFASVRAALKERIQA